VRSNQAAGSWNNTVEGNRVSDTGLLTADFGAISCIDHTASHNVTGNRVVVVGNYANKGTHGVGQCVGHHNGSLLFPFWGRGLYLDDWAISMLVAGLNGQRAQAGQPRGGVCAWRQPQQPDKQRRWRAQAIVNGESNGP
jgi:hypothetical protein